MSWFGWGEGPAEVEEETDVTAPEHKKPSDAELSAELAAQFQDEPFCSVVCLRQYLCAHRDDGDVGAASAAISTTLQWRQENGVGEMGTSFPTLPGDGMRRTHRSSRSCSALRTNRAICFGCRPSLCAL